MYYLRKDYIYKAGDIVDVNSGQLQILELITIKDSQNYNRKAYKYKCLNCGNEYQITESVILIRNLLKEQGKLYV